MITEHMTLTTILDAHQWASEMGDLTDAQVERLGDWIWDNKPHADCAFAEHPISAIEGEQMWEIAGDEEHDDYVAAVIDGATIIEYDGKKYAMTRQAELSNRVFPGWHGDADEDGEYTAEYEAPAVGQDGGDYKIRWRFAEVRGEECEDASSYDWTDIYDVISA